MFIFLVLEILDFYFFKVLRDYIVTLCNMGINIITMYMHFVKKNLIKWNYIERGEDGFEMLGHLSVGRRGEREWGRNKFEKIMALKCVF